MSDKKYPRISSAIERHAEAQSVGLTVATIRTAQGKHNPDDFPMGSPEFEALELEFLHDVLAFLGDDPDESDMFDKLGL